MPPKAKITKEMIVEEAFQIARTQGADKITARSIAQRLKCSTQPVLYYFATVEKIKEAVYQRADAYHTRFLMGTEGGGPGTLWGSRGRLFSGRSRRRGIRSGFFHSSGKNIFCGLRIRSRICVLNIGVVTAAPLNRPKLNKP